MTEFERNQFKCDCGKPAIHNEVFCRACKKKVVENNARLGLGPLTQEQIEEIRRRDRDELANARDRRGPKPRY